MRAEEVKAAGDLTGDALGGIGGMVADMHRTIAGRTFGALGPAAEPVRVLHDGIARAIHASVRGGLRAGARGAAAAAAAARPDDAPPLASSARGRLVLGALNGAVGDVLTERYRELAIDMTVRVEGREVSLDSLAVADAYPRATSKLVVFLHGLGENDGSWRLGGRPTYGDGLERELGYTPVYVAYNTGLHISDNGKRLAALLERLCGAWPVPPDELVLVGHSMGGLVARSACHYGERAWTDHVTHVFCLGAPHLGAPLERAANVAGWALGRVPETRPFASVVNGRSVGIKDLRYGACVEEDWLGCDPDEFLRDRCTEVPFLPGARYYFVGATLARREGDLVDRILGDLLVLYTSASGAGKRRRIPFEAENGRRLDGVNHFQLLNHPRVYEHLRAWLGGAPADARPLALPAG